MKITVKNVLIPIVILLLGVLIMSMLLKSQEKPQQRSTAPLPKLVEASVVNLTNVSSEISAFGRLTSAQPVILYSEVGGTLEQGQLPFQPAQSFKKGNLLLKIDDRQIKLDIKSAKSDFLAALAAVLPEIKLDFPEEFDTWQTYFNNCEFDKRIPDLPEVSNQKIKLFLSRFNVYKLYFQVSDLEIRLSKHYFYAPFDGSIVSTDLRVGSTARSGSRLGEIINLEDMEVEVPVPASEIAWIDRNKPVTFTSSELSGVWQGKIKRIGQNLDERTQAIQVYISVDKNGHPGLYNGAFLQAHIPGKPIKDAFIIPRRSIYSDKYVYLINEGKFDYREISIARDQTDSVIVNGGIQSGDTLVTDLLQGITPGMPAQIRLDKEQEDSQN